MSTGSIVVAAAGALAACGSHQVAPVVYGASPARIYSSPQEFALERQRQAAPQARRAASPHLATGGLAPLTPVTETYSEGRVADYGAKPIYIAAQTGTAYDAPPADLPGRATVLAGDTVYAISRRTGASPQAIIALNRLAPPYTLEIGETIRIPASAVPPPRTMDARALEVRGRAHLVEPGDTLFAISRATGVGVGEIAHANGLHPPYALEVGEQLQIPDAALSAREAAPVQREAAIGGNVADIARNVSYAAPEPLAPKMFDWPVKGRIIGFFGLSNAGKRNDGVNIAAPVGTPVRSAADGEVVYRGSELEGYGNLLLIKHEDGFVSAYAHNDAMLVKKGDPVRKGQVIAKVGQTGAATEPQLHFEIRQNLKAVDPLAVLGAL